MDAGDDNDWWQLWITDLQTYLKMVLSCGGLESLNHANTAIYTLLIHYDYVIFVWPNGEKYCDGYWCYVICFASYIWYLSLHLHTFYYFTNQNHIFMLYVEGLWRITSDRMIRHVPLAAPTGSTKMLCNLIWISGSANTVSCWISEM